MPFLIFAAKLCPPKVEAAMFALFMGLSNFGTITGYYVGSGMLSLFGGVEAPEFNHLGFFVVVRSHAIECTRLELEQAAAQSAV